MDLTSKAAIRQIEAMGADVLEIGLYKSAAGEVGESTMIPRVWDVESVRRSIPWLKLQNYQGRNVYVRPKGEHDLSMVDDLNADSIRRMKATGFDPALVVETSPGNFQAWLKHPRQLTREVSTAVARTLAQEFGGDLGAADWRHFGRLSGFTNRKLRHAKPDGMFPFVRLVEATGRPYVEGEALVARVESQLQVQQEQQLRYQSRAGSNGGVGKLRNIESFRSNGRYNGDGTRIDLAYAIYALAHGASEESVAAAIRSRDLTHKGSDKRQSEYVERTIMKARGIAGHGIEMPGR